MLFAAMAIWVFLLARLLIALANLLMRQWLTAGQVITNVKVSILIPARNEAENIGKLLDGVISQNYCFWEALVYDDLSTDDTAAIVQSYQNKDKRIRLIENRELPPGWMGKNHACHRLALQAKGEVLLFLDADVQLEDDLLNDSLAHMQKTRLDLLSIFPQQIMKSIGERISVPIMNWVLVSLLPLILTRKSRWPSLAAANGQHMLFRAEVYRKHLFHEQFKHRAVEDIAIARHMKMNNLRIQTLLSNGQIKCRMYHSLAGALQGFSKNVLAFFGNNVLISITIMLVTTLGFVPILLSMGPVYLILYLIAVLMLRGIVALASKQSIWQNMVTAPIQQIVFVMMVVLAIYKRKIKRNTWKGRIIHT